MIGSRTVLAAGSLAALLAFSGCDRGSADQPARPLAADFKVEDLPTLHAVDATEVGSVTDPLLGFSQVQDAAITPRGRLLVWDRDPPLARIFNREGELQVSFGRTGAGPGEFRGRGSPTIGFLGDTMWTYDRPGRLLSKFRLDDGEIVSSFRFEPIPAPADDRLGMYRIAGRATASGGVPAHVPLALTPEGFVTGLRWIQGLEPTSAEWSPGIPVDIPQLLLDESGEIIDTVGSVRAVFQEPVRLEQLEIDGSTFFVPVPPVTPRLPLFGPTGAWTFEEVEADSQVGILAVTHVDHSGDTTVHSTFEYARRPYTGDELRDIASIGAGVALLPDGGVLAANPGPGPFPDPSESSRRLLREMDFPEYHPAVAQALPFDGALWVSLGGRPLNGPASEWIVVDAERGPIGVVRDLPEERVLWRGASELVTRVSDSLGVHTVKRYSIRP